jgi:hypothetical protein
LALHRFAAGHHAHPACSSVATALSSGSFHGLNSWP